MAITCTSAAFLPKKEHVKLDKLVEETDTKLFEWHIIKAGASHYSALRGDKLIVLTEEKK